jgi:tRNA threonylcarbamoyladenosine modification (KEOPS) complex  Pcc1 subunit
MNSFTLKAGIDRERAEAIISAIKLEAESESYERSDVRVGYDNDMLALEIIAGDLHALRAAVNTYLRWVQMCENITRLGEPHA